MTARRVLEWPNPSLKIKSSPISDFDDNLVRLVDDLYDTLIAYDGAGIAAPQIGHHSRVLLIRCDTFAYNNPDPYNRDDNIIVMVNPEISCGEKTYSWREACLSVPGHSGRVTRSMDVSVTYYDLTGNKNVIDAPWPFSGAVQHEFDHLDGVLYIDRTSRFEAQKIRRGIRLSRRKKK